MHFIAAEKRGLEVQFAVSGDAKSKSIFFSVTHS